MCGIFAIFGLPEPGVNWREEGLRMSKMIRHRGPDWNGIHCDKNCVIGNGTNWKSAENLHYVT